MDKREIIKYENKHDFIQVFCRCYKASPKFLGYFQIDVMHVGKFYCHECKTMHTYYIDDFGVIYKSKVKGEKPLTKPVEELMMTEI